MNVKLVRVLQDFNAYLVDEITEKIVNEYEKVKENHAKKLAEQQLPGADHEFCGETVLSQIFQVYQIKIDHENKKLEYKVKQKQADDWYQKHEIERKRQMEEAYEERVRGDLIKAYLHRYLVNSVRKEKCDGIGSSVVEFNNGAVVRITPNLFSTKTNLRYNVKLLKSHKISKNQCELIQSGRSISETGPNDSKFFEKFLLKHETFAFHQLLEKRREHFLYIQDDKYTWDDETCQILPRWQGTKSKLEALEYAEQVKSHMLKLFT